MRRRLLPLLGLPLGAIGLVVSPASAAGYRAHWELNETGLPGPTTALDSTTNNNDGTDTGIIGDGSGYIFNGINSGVTVPDSASLSPGTSDFEFGVTLRTDLPVAGTDYDVLRKGLSSTVGGEYKIEIVNVKGMAKAMCLVKDAAKHVARVQWAPAGGLNPSAQYTIVCRKNAMGVSMTLVTPTTSTTKTKTLTTGLTSVANDGNLFLGIKSATGGDPFSGEIFDAYVS